MVLWSLLAALGRCGACVGSSWSLLGLSWRSLGPLSATLRIMCNTPSDFCRQHSPFFKLAAISVHFSCRGCTPPAHHQMQAMLLSRRSIELGRVHQSSTYQRCERNFILPNVFPSFNPADGQLDCVSDRCLRTSCEGALLLPLRAASIMPCLHACSLHLYSYHSD